MMRKCWIALALAGLAAGAPTLAGNGHLLHGVGAVNSSMGGVAVALPVEVIGALHVNPALLTQFEGDQIGFSAEAFSDAPEATATFNNTPAIDDNGNLFFRNGSFTTEGETEIGVIPAIGFSHRSKQGDWALGFGLLGVAGFRTDWPQDPTNPIFDPQPDGFGTVKTDLVISKIPLAFAKQVNPKLSIGGALIVWAGSLAITPLPPATPDCTLGSNGRSADCFYADADNRVSAYALGIQLGVYYQFNPTWSFGFAYTSPQDYDDYTWESAVALPFLRDPAGTVTPNPALGTRRVIKYPLDGPQIVSLGFGYTPGGKFKLGFDLRHVDYTSVDGAGGVGGFKPDFSLNEIGWDDILIAAVGVEYQHSPKLVIRGGFNYSETPIRSEVAFTSLGTPPTFRDHYTVGVGVQLTSNIQLNLGAYLVPQRDVSGPLLSPFLVPSPQTLDQQKVPGGTFTISEEITSVLVGLAYRF